MRFLGKNLTSRSCRRWLGQMIIPKSDDLSRQLSAFYPQQPSCQIADMWFLYELFFGFRRDGIFVEVGAFDGIYASNTWGLASQQWRGVMIEPIPEYARECRANHKHHPRVAVVNAAISSHALDHYELRVAGPLTTGRLDLADMYNQISWAEKELKSRSTFAQSETLNKVLEDHSIPKNFEVLVVDVEGSELDVFSGFDLEAWLPQMIVVELAEYHPDLWAVSTDHAQVTSRILSAGYMIVYRDRINTVFVHQSCLRRPPP